MIDDPEFYSYADLLDRAMELLGKRPQAWSMNIAEPTPVLDLFGIIIQ